MLLFRNSMRLSFVIKQAKSDHRCISMAQQIINLSG